MQATLSTLLPDALKSRLSAAVRLRTSCRAYAGPLSAGDLATLAYHTGRFALPGARLTLIPSPGDAFVDLTGSPAAVGVIICGDSWQNRLHAGFIGEAFVLEATAMGLGTCWVGGSYRRQAVTGHTAPGETLLCLIAVGLPAQPLTAPQTRRRMAPEQLCRGNWRAWPEQLIRAATLVQQAPSSMNQQPWALLQPTAAFFALDAPVRSALDAGIALCHAELALDSPHQWRITDAPGQPLATTVFR